ncbi:MAG: respiratory nitrate reductase subunit gamma [Nitrospirota bacterium]|nr:respiratory nitrate reductase subunit gamma [Nitrospirota bacterium]
MNTLLFGVLPYVLLVIGIAGAIYRYNSNRFTWSTQSSQFLENKTLFFGSFPWHYGIITVLLIHLFGFLIPAGLLAWNGSPIRLIILEVTGLAMGLLALFGLVALIYRRLTNVRAKAVTSQWDALLLLVLLIQVITGVLTAILYKWGSNWYAAAAAPYLWSIIALNPNVDLVANLPLLTKLHIINAMVIVALIPFTRLVHFFVINIYKYLSRPYQVVRWYSRDSRTENIVQYK